MPALVREQENANLLLGEGTHSTQVCTVLLLSSFCSLKFFKIKTWRKYQRRIKFRSVQTSKSLPACEDAAGCLFYPQQKVTIPCYGKTQTTTLYIIKSHLFSAFIEHTDVKSTNVTAQEINV